MKKTYTLIALLGLLVTMAVAANAQIAGRSQMRANIPFEFNVGDKTLPAGEYRVAQVNASSDQVILQISSTAGGRTAMLQMNWVKAKQANGSMLVFHRYGDKYFLAQTWIDGESDGLAAPKSRTERVTQRELAAMKAQTETVQVRTR